MCAATTTNVSDVQARIAKAKGNGRKATAKAPAPKADAKPKAETTTKVETPKPDPVGFGLVQDGDISPAGRKKNPSSSRSKVELVGDPGRMRVIVWFDNDYDPTDLITALTG